MNLQNRLASLGIIAIFALLAAGTGSKEPESPPPPPAPAPSSPTLAVPQAPAVAPSQPAPTAGAAPDVWSPAAEWDDRNCPATIWALFRQYVPPGDEFARREAEGQRAALEASLRAQSFRMTVPARLGDYDFEHHRFPIIVEAPVLRCDGPESSYTWERFDRDARVNPRDERSVSLALVDASAASRQVGELGGSFTATVREWTAAPATLGHVDVAEADAARYRETHSGPQLEVLFRLARARVDSRSGGVVSTATSERVSLDVGAGPVVAAEVVALRLKDRAGVTLLDTSR